LWPCQNARFDYEYERNGVCAVFMLHEPLRGWREVVVADQRIAIDFAHVGVAVAPSDVH
jgi:hypothetical protein